MSDTEYYKGKICRLRMYPRQLSFAKVRRMYQKERKLFIGKWAWFYRLLDKIKTMFYNLKGLIGY